MGEEELVVTASVVQGNWLQKPNPGGVELEFIGNCCGGYDCLRMFATVSEHGRGAAVHRCTSVV